MVIFSNLTPDYHTPLNVPGGWRQGRENERNPPARSGPWGRRIGFSIQRKPAEVLGFRQGGELGRGGSLTAGPPRGLDGSPTAIVEWPLETGGFATRGWRRSDLGQTHGFP